ncbi:MAG: TIR domain-containing protein [Dokdonella sp.]
MARDPATVSERRYRAFISYSHRDEAWAVWLHKALEAYRVPSRLVGLETALGKVPHRLTPIFRDREELASAHDLNGKVAEALVQSESLIVICSPQSAVSHWVDEEVLAYKKLGRGERIFCLIVEGEPGASARSGREAKECLAPALRHGIDANGRSSDDPAEPIAADARPGMDGKTNAKLKLIAGLLDIGFDTLKQREQHRRVRRLSMIAITALLLMMITSGLAINAVVSQRAAVEAQKAAEQRQKQAEDLVDFMLGDLNDKLAKVQRLEIMESVDDQAMKYFQSLPTRDVTDESLVQRAKALEKIGSIRFDQGQLPAALDAYQASLKLAERLAQAEPANSQRQLAYSRVRAFVGQTFWYQGDLDSAQGAFESARQTLRQALTHSPGNQDLQFQQAVLSNNIGHILESRGMFEQATAEYQSMLALCQALVAADPDKTAWQVHLGLAHNNLGKQALIKGDLTRAIAEYRSDDSIESRLSEADPKDNDQRTTLLVVRAILGRTLALAGDVDTGMGYLQQAVDIAAQMVAVDPTISSVQELLALYSSQLARLRRLSGDLRDATTLTTSAIRIFATLTHADPTNSSWKREMAEALVEQSAQSGAAGMVTACLDQANSALALLEPLLKENPGDQSTRLATVAARLRLADASSSAAEKTRLRETAIATLQSVQDGKDDPRLRALLVETLLSQDRNDEAAPLIRQLWDGGFRDPGLLAVLQRKHIDYPVNPAYPQPLKETVAAKTPSGGRPGKAQPPQE